MKTLWSQVGFTPVAFKLDEEDFTEDDIQQAKKDVPVLEKERFPPTLENKEPSKRDIEKSDGITIRNIPRILEDKDIVEFLINYGLPLDHSIENLRINRAERNTWVIIDGLNPSEVQTLFLSIHFPE